MLKEFRDFIARGNVLDLAVAVIIGAAFATITASLTDDIIMPIVGAAFGGLDFSNYFAVLGPIPADYHGSADELRRPQESGRGGARLGPVPDRPAQLPDPRLRDFPARARGQSHDPQRARTRRPGQARSNCSPKSATN